MYKYRYIQILGIFFGLGPSSGSADCSVIDTILTPAVAMPCMEVIRPGPSPRT